MRVLIPLLALTLAACGQSTSAPVPEAPIETAAPPAESVFGGSYTAISDTAMSITGTADIDTDAMNFTRGFRIEGLAVPTTLTGDTDYSAGGGTISDSSGVRNIEHVEMRKIDNVRVAADARDPQLCGEGKAATYAILAENADTLSMLIFSGADAPGPNAHDTQLCGIFNYAPA